MCLPSPHTQNKTHTHTNRNEILIALLLKVPSRNLLSQIKFTLAFRWACWSVTKNISSVHRSREKRIFTSQLTASCRKHLFCFFFPAPTNALLYLPHVWKETNTRQLRGVLWEPPSTWLLLGEASQSSSAGATRALRWILPCTCTLKSFALRRARGRGRVVGRTTGQRPDTLRTTWLLRINKGGRQSDDEVRSCVQLNPPSPNTHTQRHWPNGRLAEVAACPVTDAVSGERAPGYTCSPLLLHLLSAARPLVQSTRWAPRPLPLPSPTFPRLRFSLACLIAKPFLPVYFYHF